MNIENLRYRGIPVFRRDNYLYVEGHTDDGDHLIAIGPDYWYAFRSWQDEGHGPDWRGSVGNFDVAVQCLIDNGVLTVVSEAPAAASMKFIRLPAPLPWKANEILRTADVNAIYGDVSTYTADIPAAKADAIVALLLLLDINAKSYEV